MADEKYMMTEDDVVAERIVEGEFAMPFVWISLRTWQRMEVRLSADLREELAPAREADGNYVVLPRLIWILATALAEARPIQD